MDLARKIKSVEEVAEILGDIDRAQPTIMIAGTFDLVHAGHIRHMLYAKSKAPILIANVTSDAHIAKGNLRPYVPQDLRAQNLAVMEMVDYVVIDKNPTPLENISILKPNYFSKGYEYGVATGAKTKAEQELVESYGGEMIFTPGDVVYSSSKILNTAPPRLGIEKLLTLMQGDGLTFNHLRRTLLDIKRIRVHVIGDTIVDSHTYATPTGGIGKTPTLSVRYDRKEDFVGGAAIVAKHLRAAGAEVEFSTILGNDLLANFVTRDLVQNGILIESIKDGRCTTNKNAIIANDYRLLKVDHVENRTIGEDSVARLCDRISSVATDAVIFSDFRHGIFNESTIPHLTSAINDAVFCAADSQVASRWGNILDFKEFNLITPNEKEARFALGDQDSVIRPLADKLYKQALCQTLILKCGEAGTLTMRSDDPNDFRATFALDSFCHHPIDPVGAGDALLSYSSLALASGSGAVTASILGGIAAGLECEHDGNYPITSDKVLERINKIERIANYEEIA